MLKIFVVEFYVDFKVIFFEVLNVMIVYYENKVFGLFLVLKKCVIFWFEVLLVEFF